MRQLQDVPRRVRRPVNIPKLMLEAKAAHQAEHGLDRADWVLARAEGFAALGSNFAPLVNALLGAPVGPLGAGEALRPVAHGGACRRSPSRNFFRRARGMAGARKSEVESRQFHPSAPATATPRVAYFVDVFANYNDPLIGEATVAVLRHNGIEVYVPPRQVGCGMAALAVGDVETARELARPERPRPRRPRPRGLPHRLLRADRGAHAVAGLPRPPRRPRRRLVAANTVELTAFLGELHDGRRAPHRLPPLDLTLGHHVPCHLKALRGPARRAPAAVAHPRRARPHHRRGLFRHGGHVGAEGRELRDLAGRRRAGCSPS